MFLVFKRAWRNGSAFDSRSKGWVFESLCPHSFYFSFHSFIFNFKLHFYNGVDCIFIIYCKYFDRASEIEREENYWSSLHEAISDHAWSFLILNHWIHFYPLNISFTVSFGHYGCTCFDLVLREVMVEEHIPGIFKGKQCSIFLSSCH